MNSHVAAGGWLRREVTPSTVPVVDRDQGEAESRLVTVARQVAAGQRGPSDFMDVFVNAVVFARRSQRSALLVTELGERGRWTVVFLSLTRLTAHAGECEYLSTTGADFLEL
jgi:hypothetical protein